MYVGFEQCLRIILQYCKQKSCAVKRFICQKNQTKKCYSHWK